MRHELVKIKPYLTIPLFVVGTVAIAVLLIDNANLDNTAYGQSLLFPNAQKSGAFPNPSPILQHYQQQQQLPPPNQQYQSNLHLVKITLPTKGQQVPVGKDLLVYGTSTGNATSGCKVSIKVNSISPYHDASPGGQNDFSKWNFTLSPAYTAVKLGQNKITAKFACKNEPTLASHYSINVTGVGTVATPTGPSQQNLQTTLSTNGGINSAAANRTHTSTSNAIHVSPSKHSPVNNNNHRVSLLSLSIRIGKSSVLPGDTEIVTIMAADKNSTKAIMGSSVVGNISSSSGLLKKFKGATDNNGKASYSWKVGARDIGKYKVIAQVYSPNYDSKSASKTFNVSPRPVIDTSPSSTNYNSLTSSNDASNNNNNNNNNNTSSAAHNNNSIIKNRHQHTFPLNSISSGNSNSSLTPSSHAHGSNNNTKKGNLATSNALHSNNSKNQNIHHPTSTINPDHPFGVPITHVPFVIP